MGKKAKGSRKGKKAWRANISTEEIEDFFEKSTKDALSGGSLQALSSDSLFYEDKSKDIAVKKKIEKHREKVLHCDSLLQKNQFVKPVPSSILKKCSKNRKTVSNVKVVNQDGDKDDSTVFDLWNDKGEDNKHVKKVAKPTLIPAVEVDPPGCSFNPSYESHQDTLASAVAEEMQKIYKKELGPKPVPLTVPGEAITEEDMYFLDVDDGNDDEDSTLENEGENENATSEKKLIKTKRVTKVELNKRARRKEQLKKEAEANKKKELSKDIDSIPDIIQEIEQEDEKKKKRHLRRQVAKQEMLKTRPPRIGKHKFEPAPVQVLLSEEITGSIRKLKGCCTLVKDRYKSLEKRGLILPTKRRLELVVPVLTTYLCYFKSYGDVDISVPRFLLFECDYRIRANVNLLRLLALQLEHFDDFTIASSWERFISEIEAVCRIWMADGPKRLLDKGAVTLGYPKNSYKVKSELKYAMKSYCMEYCFETNINGKPGTADWRSSFHDLQLCFGVKEFLVISPKSASSVVLDVPEASKLLSAVAIALSNCSSLWPAFVPVHDPSRKAYIGIQNLGTVFTRRFEADWIGSQVPIRLLHLEGLYELFVSKFLTYKMLPYDDDNITAIDAQNTNSGESLICEAPNETLWDNACPWSEWYSAEDPVKGFELITIWSEKMVESSTEMAELENASPYEAEKWLISPSCAPKLLEGSEWNQIGFASRLHFLVDALKMSFKAQFMENFVSDENFGSDNLNSSIVIPPPTVRDRVLKKLFQEGTYIPGKPDMALRVGHSAYGGNKTSRAIKGAPLESLFAQFCLHSLWLGDCNIRAIAVLWMEFVQEVRRCWEESQLIPRMPANGSIDISTCLINQKLLMLALCIEKKCEIEEDYQDCIGSEDQIESMTEEESVVGDDSFNMQRICGDFSGDADSFPTAGDMHYSVRTVSAFSGKLEDPNLFNDKKSSDGSRRGSAGIVDSMMLLKSNESMHPPYTQEAPLMTEDMQEEFLQAVEGCSDPLNFATQVERDTIASNMSAFKAANPDAVLEDFIRWHSPGDWIVDDLEVEMSKDNWPPRGRLSKRMSENGNSWRNIWSSTPALPVSEHKPLLDPNREGEKVLHYLEALHPHQLLEQMVCTAFGAAADTLIQSNYGELKLMGTMMQYLYLTLSPALKPLQENRLSADSETIDDLRRMCVVFQHVEKLLTLAVSLHRKFLQAPRLAREIFNDFYSFYFPRMGIGLMKEKEFDKKQAVWNEEREVVSNMLVQPTANQSWRKVLSMGNLLNGHEPILRETIFSVHGMNGNHYATSTTCVSERKIETYRMRIEIAFKKSDFKDDECPVCQSLLALQGTLIPKQGLPTRFSTPQNKEEGHAHEIFDYLKTPFIAGGVHTHARDVHVCTTPQLLQLARTRHRDYLTLQNWEM
ncbi:unnamed protein product [Sphenostylis stenocarpa]|uniref:Rab3 GTPase-activating protein catalytic subunit n=1 Tax=Sphenostylis stenocarpa TaxID=92480 RepID=A0AA86TJQ2_9FABA|nr:unnamed protein product [Sphenostylis stenocarpa]